MILLRKLAELTIHNPLFRLKLKTRSAYHWFNVILMVSLAGITIAELTRFYLFCYSAWLDSHLPDDLFHPAVGMTIASDYGHSLSVWDELSYATSLWAVLIIVALTAFRALSELIYCAVPLPRSDRYLNEEVLATPIRPSQILFAHHDWPYIKLAGVILAACALLALPSRLDWMNMGGQFGLFRFTGNFSVYGMVLSPDLSLSLWTISSWCIAYAIHRTILVIRFRRTDFFRSWLFLGWLCWLILLAVLKSHAITRALQFDEPVSLLNYIPWRARPVLGISAGLLLVTSALVTQVWEPSHVQNSHDG